MTKPNTTKMQEQIPGDFPAAVYRPHDPAILNLYNCGCQIRHGDSGGVFIFGCPIHRHARELLEALKYLVEIDAKCSSTLPTEVIDKARAVLAKCGNGKPSTPCTEDLDDRDEKR